MACYGWILRGSVFVALIGTMKLLKQTNIHHVSLPKGNCLDMDIHVLFVVDTFSSIPRPLFKDLIEAFELEEPKKNSQTLFSAMGVGEKCYEIMTYHGPNKTASVVNWLHNLFPAGRKLARFLSSASISCAAWTSFKFQMEQKRKAPNFYNLIVSIAEVLSNPEHQNIKVPDFFKANISIATIQLKAEYVSPALSSVMPGLYIVPYNPDGRSRSHIAFLLCFKCKSGWTPFEFDDGHYRPSCLYFGRYHRKMSPVTAQMKCHEAGGIIASFDTLANPKMLISALDRIHGNKTEIVSYHIGLFRRKELWGGWSTRWGSGAPFFQETKVIIEQNSTGSKECFVLTYKRQKIYKFTSVSCWEESGAHYFCYSSQMYQQAAKTRLEEGSLFDPKNEELKGNLRKCYHAQSRKIIFVPAISSSRSQLECFDTLFVLDKKTFTKDAALEILPQFDCGDSFGTVIGYESVCNVFVDCPNRNDEKLCEIFDTFARVYSSTYRPCNITREFSCKNRQCVPLDARCDFVTDCFDGSDEMNCPDCQHFTCPDGKCIPWTLVNDGVKDCESIQGGLSDESMVKYKGKALKKNFCTVLCNGTDCADLSVFESDLDTCIQVGAQRRKKFLKEAKGVICHTENNTMKEWGPRCLFIEDRIGTVVGCRNYNHLMHCKDISCPAGFEKCSSYDFCIPEAMILKGDRTCPGGYNTITSDKKHKHGDSLGIFGCFSVYQLDFYIPLLAVCDGSLDCPNGKDEMDCQTDCLDGFVCAAGAVVSVDEKKTENYNLSDVIPFISKDTKYIRLTGLNVGSTIQEMFLTYVFSSIVHLALSRCKITTLQPSIRTSLFNSMQSFLLVRELDLSHNEIEHIYRGSLVDSMKSLRVLNLSGNKKLSSVVEVIAKKDKLLALDLSHTSISQVPRAILKLRMLEWLNLEGCPITLSKQGLFPIGLKYLDLKDITRIEIKRALFANLTEIQFLFVNDPHVCCEQILGNVSDRNCYPSKGNTSAIACKKLVVSSFLRPAMWIIAAFGLLLNGKCIIRRVQFERKYHQSLSRAYILALINVADLSMSLALVIVGMAATKFDGNYILHDQQWRSSFPCRVVAFLVSNAVEVSMFSFAAITLERYLVSSYPLDIPKFTKQQDIWICVTVATLSVAIACIPALLPSSLSRICSPVAGQPSGDLWIFNLVFYGVVNTLLYLWVVIGIRKVHKILFNKRTHFSKTFRQSDFVSQKQLAVERYLTKSLMPIVISSFCHWCPPFISVVYTLTGPAVSLYTLTWVALVVMPFCSIFNPIVYTGANYTVDHKGSIELTTMFPSGTSRTGMSDEETEEDIRRGPTQFFSSLEDCMTALTNVSRWMENASATDAKIFLQSLHKGQTGDDFNFLQESEVDDADLVHNNSLDGAASDVVSYKSGNSARSKASGFTNTSSFLAAGKAMRQRAARSISWK